MAQNFIGCDRDQALLLPPDLREWLPERHLAWFVIGIVEELDLDGIYGYYRQDGRGRPAHDPAMMVAVLLYAYAVGVTSSRAIERRCEDDVAFRVISADRRPDHSTIARFLLRHRDAVEGLFFDVLGLCRQAGMVRVGTVAIDSTKLAANASAAQNRTLSGLEAEAARIIEEAIETDRREDERYGSERGDELPEELADPASRQAKIKELLERARRERAEVEAEQAGKVADYDRHVAETARRKTGRPPKREGTQEQHQRLFAKKYNLTDPDSGIVRHRGMLMQGYSIQTVASEDQIILAATPTGQSPDHGQLTPMLQTARENLKRVGITEPVSEVLADSGYWNTSQVRELTVAGHDVLIPPIVRGKRHGPEVQTMLDRLDTDGGKQRYRRRQHIIEPVFARCKHHRGITRVLRRGKTAVQSEISLIATTHNLLKLHTALQAG